LLLHREINHTLYIYKIIVSLNYLQFYYVQNSSDKNYKIRQNIIRNKIEIIVQINVMHLKLIFKKDKKKIVIHVQCE
jgi:hypothetical protein